MTLGFKQRNAIRKIAEILYNFLPASGHQTWKGHVNFGSVAFKLGLSEYWTGGSKLPAIINLLESTYERKIGIFQNLIETVVLEGKTYRNNKGNPTLVEGFVAIFCHRYVSEVWRLSSAYGASEQAWSLVRNSLTVTVSERLIGGEFSRWQARRKRGG